MIDQNCGSPTKSLLPVGILQCIKPRALCTAAVQSARLKKLFREKYRNAGQRQEIFLGFWERYLVSFPSISLFFFSRSRHLKSLIKSCILGREAIYRFFLVDLLHSSNFLLSNSAKWWLVGIEGNHKSAATKVADPLPPENQGLHLHLLADTLSTKSWKHFNQQIWIQTNVYFRVAAAC